MPKNNVKKRHWAFVCYPESAPSDWLNRLQDSGLPCAVSPLHDSDVDPTGAPKKAHYHVILSYSGPTTFSAVSSLTDSLSQPIPQPLESVKGYYRYFTHADNPDKAQYDPSGIRLLNGFNISDYAELTTSELRLIRGRIIDLIRALDFTEYSALIDYLYDSGLTDEFDFACNHTLMFDRYLGSRRHASTTAGSSKN